MAVLKFFDNEEQTWADMSVNISGAPCSKIRGIKYTIESQDEELYAAGDEAISIQSGNISKSGSMKLLKEAIDNMQAAAIVAGGRSLLDVRFNVIVQYLPVTGGALTSDTLVGVKVNKLPKGWDQGAKYMEVDLDFKFLRLVTV